MFVVEIEAGYIQGNCLKLGFEMYLIERREPDIANTDSEFETGEIVLKWYIQGI